MILRLARSVVYRHGHGRSWADRAIVLDLLGSSLNSIGQAFIPSESIQTGNAMRYRTRSWDKRNIRFSRRSAFTFSGSYGLLHFSDAGYISSQMLNVQAGYDYLLDPKNSIAILAGYGKIDYTGLAQFHHGLYCRACVSEGKSRDAWHSRRRRDRS